MADTAKGLLILTHATDSNQASFETGICLCAVTGDDNDLAVFDFCKTSTLEDTVS